jgi:GTP-binding protein HflX
VAPAEVRRLLFGHRDAVALSATDRDSTRRLLERIAEALEDRWTRSALVPSYPLAEEVSDHEEREASVAELTTLEELTGRRKGRRAAARA